MKKIIAFTISVFTLSLTGCWDFGVKGHQVFTKNRTLHIETISQIMNKLNYDENYYFDTNTSQYNRFNIWTNEACDYDFDDDYIKKLTIDSKVITQYFNKKGVACGGANETAPALVGLCSNKIPTDKNIDSNTYFQALVIREYISPSENAQKKKLIKATVIFTPKQLKNKKMLDDNNLSKGDICIYPLTNIHCGTLKKDDWFTIPKEEMDKALTKFYDEQNN